MTRRVTTKSVMVFCWAVVLWSIDLGSGFGHGLMQDPPSRNWFCGAVTKPHEVTWGEPEYPICGEAFEPFENGPADGYQFMSVLTHTQGRSEVTPLPSHVCGFGSETWNGGETPWDQPIDWPTNNMSAGRQEFTWNIFWGPHFSDTEEFRYWITKPGFQYQLGTPLSWGDFEAEPFCVLNYDHNNPNANPDVVPEVAESLFHTFCDVPSRSGRHVIYAEWGRNQWTFERFHGCVDVNFEGEGPGDIVANIALTPDVNEFMGAGTLQLSASQSQGENLNYQWSIDSITPELYTLSAPNSVETSLILSDPLAANYVTITLMVSSNGENDSKMVTFMHLPSGGSAWIDLGQVSPDSQTLNPNDKVQVRVNKDSGEVEYFPPSPFLIEAGHNSANDWVFGLAESINSATTDLRIGALDANDNVEPSSQAAENRIYAAINSGIVSAFVEIDEFSNENDGTCAVLYDIVNQWNNGFEVGITITNQGNSAINGYNLEWSLGDNETFDQGWNATFTTSGSTVSASNPSSVWNGVLQPQGGTSVFGFLGKKSIDQNAFPPTNFSFNGKACDIDTSNGDNAPPVANFTVNPDGLQVSVDASGSSDEDGDILTYSWDFGDGGSATGVSASHTYSAEGTYTITVTVSDGEDQDSSSTRITLGGSTPSQCTYKVTDDWGAGFVATITITNAGPNPMHGWDVGWSYNDGSIITHSWNATLSGGDPYSARNLSWNETIQPGNQVTFGFQGTNGSGAAAVPTVTGEVCR